MIPEHVAIIMDGNGRWATKRGLPRSKGHLEGSKNLEKLIPYIFEKGVKVLSLYAFLNILLFVPYGFLLSCMSSMQKKKRWVNLVLTTLISLGTSMLIETVQFMSHRGYYELDDLILNTVGGSFGAVFYMLLYEAFCGKQNCKRNGDKT